MIIDFGMDVYRIESHDRECLWQSSVIDIRTIIQKSCSNLMLSVVGNRKCLILCPSRRYLNQAV